MTTITSDVPDIERLQAGITLIQDAASEDLRSTEFVAGIIRKIGLSFDPRLHYGSDNIYMNTSRFGLWQIPLQLAKTLVFLSEFRPRSLLEIGTFKGWTSTVLAAYLQRFNSDAYTVTIDPIRHIEPYPFWEELNLEYLQTDSQSLAGRHFNLCFIDGDHSAESLCADYMNVGRFADICIFHDIQEELCPDVRAFWSTVKKTRSHLRVEEFLDHSMNAPVMGIGVLVQKQLVAREAPTAEASRIQVDK